MRMIYKVNGKQVDLSRYLYAEYHNLWSELKQYSLERFLKKHPDIIERAINMPDVDSAKELIISEWKKSEEFADYMQAYSKSSPEKDARQRAGCMIIFWIILTIACIIGIACQIQ